MTQAVTHLMASYRETTEAI